MADGIIRPGDWQKWVDEQRGALARAVTTGVTAAADGLLLEMRQQVRSALGERMARAVGREVFPRKGRVSLRTVATVGARSKRGQVALQAFLDGAEIRSRGGQYLAIPLPAVPKRPGRGGGRKMTPVEVEAAFNAELRFVPRPGRAPLLVLDNVVAAANRRGFRQATARRLAQGRGTVTVAMFVLVRSVRLGKRLDFKSLYAKWLAELPNLIERALPRS